MKKTRKLLIALLSFVLLVSMSLGLVACGPTISVELSESTLTLKERSNAYQLTAVVKENDVAVSNPALTWASSDTAVVTVNDGLVAVVGLGSADVTVTYNGKSATCAVTVEASTFAISLDQTTLALKDRSAPVQLNATAVIDGATQSNPALVWASSNDEVVTVENGLVTVVGLGSADVTCSFEGQTATCAVTVTETIFGISLDQTSLALKTISAPVTLVASATIDGAADANAQIVWTSSNEEVATVENGVVTVVGAGDAVITASYENVSATCAVNVVVPVYAIALDQTALALKTISAPVTLVASASIDGEADANAQIVWASSNEDVVVVENGVVTVVGAGDAVVTATYQGKTAECAVNVVVPVYAIELDQTALALKDYSEPATLVAIATIDGEADADAEIVWASSNEEVVTVENGVVTVVGLGDAVITATYQGKTAECAVNVSEPVYAVELENYTLGLTTENTFGTIGLIGLTRDGEAYTIEGATVAWSVEDASIVKVVNGGVGALKVGETTVTCSYVLEDGSVFASASCVVTVEAEWVEVATGEEFVATIQAKHGAYIKLTSDIVINNNNILEGATPGYNGTTIVKYEGRIEEAITGTIDGQGYTMVVNANDTGRPNGVLFGRFDGVMKNLNIVIRTHNWTSGNTEKMGSIVGILNGTIEDCVVTFAASKWNLIWTLQFAIVSKMGENAAIRNVAFYGVEGISSAGVVVYENNAGENDRYYPTSIIENVAVIIDKPWTDSSVQAIPMGMSISGLYLFNSLEDMANGNVAYAHDGTAMVAATETIDFEEVFGYQLTPVAVSVRSGSYISGSEPPYSDVEQTLYTAVMADATKAEGVQGAIFNMETMEIVTEIVADANADTAAQIYLYVVDAEGNEISSPLLSFIPEIDNVVSVASNGTINVISEGVVNLYVYYYGNVVATIKVTAIPKYVTVTTAQELYDAIQTNSAIKLGADITIYNESSSVIEGATKVAGFKVYLADTFNGVIDGQGYTLTLNTTENGRPWGGIFVTLNGTIKNVNIVSIRSDWGDGNNRKIGFITNMNGTIENCTVTTRYHRFGNQTWNIVWSVFENVGSSAVVKNCVFNSQGDLANVIPYVANGATFENVAFMLPLNQYYSLIGTISTAGNYKNVYCFSTVSNVVNGKASSQVTSEGVVDVTETVDIQAIFGVALVSNDITYSVIEGENAKDITVPVITFAPAAE